MDYQKVYDALMLKRIQNPAVKTRPGTVEIHHVKPRSFGGSDDKSNLVKLTSKEHFVAHHLLWRIYNNKEMACAFFFMCSGKHGVFLKKINAREYEKLRQQYSEIVSERFKGKPSPLKGRTLSDEHRAKISKGVRKAFTPEVLKRISEGTKRGLTPEAKKKISEFNKGRKLSEEAKQKIAASKIGKKLSPEWRKHVSESLKGKAAGKMWINNGVIEKTIPKGSEIPEGFKRGQLPEHYRHLNRTGKPAWNKGLHLKQLSQLSKNGWEKRRINESKLTPEQKLEKAKNHEMIILTKHYPNVDFSQFDIDGYMKMTQHFKRKYRRSYIQTHSKMI